LAAAGAALDRAGEAYSRLCALVGAPEGSAGDEPKKRSYRVAENELWVHAVVAAFELGVSRTTVWRWAEENYAQWPHGDAQQVDINRLRHLRPPGGKNGKLGK
jgi:hypothetical protein